LEKGFEFFDALRRNAKVSDCMAIRAERAEVFDGVNLMLLSNAGYWIEVVNVDISIGDRPVGVPEVHAAGRASGPVKGKAAATSLLASLVSEPLVPSDRTLRKGFLHNGVNRN
jgi:hypothetical protein